MRRRTLRRALRRTALELALQVVLVDHLQLVVFHAFELRGDRLVVEEDVEVAQRDFVAVHDLHPSQQGPAVELGAERAFQILQVEVAVAAFDPEVLVRNALVTEDHVVLRIGPERVNGLGGDEDNLLDDIRVFLDDQFWHSSVYPFRRLSRLNSIRFRP